MSNGKTWLTTLAFCALSTAAFGAGMAGRTAAPGSPAGAVGSSGPGLGVDGGVRASTNAAPAGNGISGVIPGNSPAPTLSGTIPGNPNPAPNGVVNGGTVIDGNTVTYPNGTRVNSNGVLNGGTVIDGNTVTTPNGTVVNPNNTNSDKATDAPSNF